VVLTPANGYGQRVTRGIEAALDQSSVKLLKTQDYDAATTSFASTVKPLMGLLRRPRSAVLVADSAARTGLVMRQLRREGLSIDAAGSAGRPALATAEGMSPALLKRAKGALDGVVVAPVASLGAGASEFAAEHERLYGEPPSAQALLVWRALSRAWAGEAAASPDTATLLQVQGGRLVPFAQEAG
jgi:hypothetical protein